MSDTPMLDAALTYAALGWPVLPLHTPTTFGPKTGEGRAQCSCRNPGCESQGKHPRTRDGLKAAATDAETIGAWWHLWPDANIGLRTGVVFDVMDLDGAEALDALDAAAPEDVGELVGPMVVTGRAGGIHIYMRPTGLGNRAGGRAGMPPGVDWRGVGGYVVAPPSIHHLGTTYCWGAECGADTPLQLVPAWLLNMLRGSEERSPCDSPRSRPRTGQGDGDAYGQAALERICGRMVTAPVGGRNDALNAAAYGLGRVLARGGVDQEAAVATLVEAARRSGLPDREIVATLRSGLSKGLAAGRSDAGGR